MQKWAESELQQADLGDARRNKRLVRIVEDLASQPASSVPQACGDIAATSAAYDFWNSPYFQPSDIRNAQIKSTIERIKEHQVILAIQDTTNIDLTDHPATSGLGYLDHRKSSGLKVHSTFAATIKGVPLGIINQQVWSREAENIGIAKKRRQRETQEKDSSSLVRWIISNTNVDTKRNSKRINMALATYSIVAWRLLWLTYEARVHPDLPCDTVLEPNEWQSLCATINKNPIPPHTPPSLRQAVRMIANLGGFLGRKGDGEPGVKTIWRGLRRLHDIAATWKLLHPDSPKTSK
ncbi:hypothetical protein IQ229_11190 [Nostoc cf. edaphicum LEGE 07299]|uniref:Transposase n=1 Tax=Nostoc cf. edaphicum LEGE 07299 TaxID=2777974 RepID=A0ABR9TZM9_9NOSO|nr:transposase DNA-binding-containing protein [Nostoc edaphicum]MBE9105485.1 hypothetical protein [Nostoc cf. edaphicum LEGE 07299]